MSNKTIWVTHAVLLTVAAVFMYAASLLAGAATTEDLSREARTVLDKLYSNNATAALLGRNARAVLVFPRLIRAGLTARPYTAFSGAYSEGALFKGSSPSGFYKLISSTWKPEVDGRTVSCVVFLMTAEAEATLGSGTWTVEAGAILDRAKSSMSTVSIDNRDSYVLVFDESGLITAGSLQGAKVSQIAN